jgi:hypothetical protein
MAIKTFTSGEVLTAADTNTYLANSGLVYVTSQTVGTAVASVTVSSAFSTTYDSYRIIYQMGDASATEQLFLKFNNSTGATYSHGGIYVLYGTALAGPETANNTASGIRIGNTNADFSSIVFDVINPFLATPTHVMAQHADAQYWSVRGGRDSNTVSQTGFSLTPGSGTLTGGTITVYGYRKA